MERSGIRGIGGSSIRLGSLTPPNGQVITTNRDAVGRIVNVNTPVNGQTLNVIDQVQINPLNQVTRQTFGNSRKADAR